VSRFEFIFVLISIVAGIALTQLLSGLPRSLRPAEGKVDIAHVLFSLATILLLMAVWWNSFRWEQSEAWTFVEYSLIFVYISIFYVMAAILHPTHSSAVPKFNEVRTQFYVVFFLYNFVEILVVYVRDGYLSPWGYLPLPVHLGVLAGTGIFLRNRRFDQFFGAWYLLITIAFEFSARLAG
jgi:hypothetical protein